MEGGVELENEMSLLGSRLKQTQDKIAMWTTTEANDMLNNLAIKHDTFMKQNMVEQEKYKIEIAHKQKKAVETDQVVEQKCQQLEHLKTELEKLCSCTQELHTVTAKGQSEIAGLETDIKTIKKEIDAPTKVKQKLEYLSQASAVFGDMLGLTFKKTRGNKMQIIFTHIDERDPLMAFYFFLQLQGAGRSYMDPEPPVEGLEDLVAQLNETKNLRQFMINIRKKFKDTVKK